MLEVVPPPRQSQESRTLNIEGGSVTGKIMLNTLLNHWIKYCGNPNSSQNRSSKELFEIKGFHVVLLPRLSVLTLILGTRPGQLEWEKHEQLSGKQQYVLLEELLSVSQFKKSLTQTQLLTTTCIEIDDSLRGTCCWESQCQTSRL